MARTSTATTPAKQDAIAVLVDVARELTGADRVEVALVGRHRTASGTAAEGSPPTHFEVLDGDDPVVTLRFYGVPPGDLGDVVAQVAALLVVAAAAEQRPERERAWVGRLGHDLKTPLTAVLGFAGLLGGGGVAAASPELVGAARRVTETGERLLTELEDDLAHWRG